MRFFIEISYKGTNFHGWQEQPNVQTIQAEINKALSTILYSKIQIVGAGRTDAGVHAKQMFAHFDSDINFDIKDLLFKINNFLSHDIVVHDIFEVNKDANSRFDAISRTYQYNIISSKNPFNEMAYLFKKELDLIAMNSACKYILGKQDFTSFSKVNTQTFTNNCNVMHARWERKDCKLIFNITSDRFLRNMVRSIVGTMLEVGIGKILPSNMISIIEAKDRCAAGASVPAHGLFLMEINYSKNIRK